MKKLASIRQTLLASPLGLAPAQVLTFAEKGVLGSWHGPQNRHFLVRYWAHVIVTDYVGEPQDLLWLAAEWLHGAEPGAQPEAITFQVDILDHGSADVSLRIEVTETVRAKPVDGGTVLTSDIDPDALTMMDSLFGGQTP